MIWKLQVNIDNALKLKLVKNENMARKEHVLLKTSRNEECFLILTFREVARFGFQDFQRWKTCPQSIIVIACSNRAENKTISLSNSSNKSAQHYEALATSNDPSSLRCKRLTIWQMGLDINFPKKYCYDNDNSRFLATSLRNSCGSQLLRYDFSRRSLIFCCSHLCASCREEL